LGRVIYWNISKAPNKPPVVANWDRLRVLTWLVLSFFVGGVLGALGFKHLGYSATIPLAILLVTLASIPVVDDLQGMVKQRQGGR
jgi:hypothetical protein